MRSLLLSLLVASALLTQGEVLRGQVATESSEPSNVVRAGDLLGIQVWPDSVLSGEFTVEETGYVYLPVLGRVLAAGVPLGELRGQLREAYSESLRNPIVSISLQFRVSVLGAVRRPGLYLLEPTQTVWDAVSIGGGFTEAAKEDEIRIIRGDQVYSLNAERAVVQGESALAVPLQSGDRIMVPEGSRIQGRDVLIGLQMILTLVSIFSR